jgi:hypothetical protein
MDAWWQCEVPYPFVALVDGRVEDAHMAICHMLCYAFMENGKKLVRP